MTVTEDQHKYKNNIAIVGVKMSKKYTAVFTISWENGK